MHTYIKNEKLVPVSIETSIKTGETGIFIKGIRSETEKKEILLRVLTALQASASIDLPKARIEIKIKGTERNAASNLDLPIAVSLYEAISKDCLLDTEKWILHGGLHLDGTLSPMGTSLEIISQARATNMKVFLPGIIYKDLNEENKRFSCKADSIREVIDILDKF